MIPYGRQSVNQDDIDAVIAVLKSDFLTQGPLVPIFEKTVADYCGVQYAVAVNSATSALHIACLALGVQKGDIVWTSPITFVASANCALYCGATLDFVDIDPRTYNMSVTSLIKKLELAKKTNQIPKVLIPVHMCGQSCDMAAIYDLSKQYGFNIIEDASHSIGGRYKNLPIGSCHYSDITVFSFHPVKIITSGEGGMALTKNHSLEKRLRLFRSHGITSAESDMKIRPSSEIWNYQQIDLGFNYRMTEIQAALGLSQMKRLDDFIKKRQSIAKRYNKLLLGLPLITPYQQVDSYSAYHLYVIRLKMREIKITQRQFYESLQKSNIFVNLHYIPVYRQPYYENLGFKKGHCPRSEEYYAEAISIPIFTDLSEEQQDQVISTIKNILI